MGDETGDPRGRSPFDREGLLMCLAIPMVLIERDEFQGVAEIDGVRREISVMYVPEAEVGDYVLVHAGFAIGQVDADEAAKTLELLREYADSMVEL
jgi:hydrogenase expression/formation protein HypC